MLGEEQIAQVVAKVKVEPPRTLILVSHFPLLNEESVARTHGGKYAGHFQDGTKLLEELSELVQNRIVIFSGHNHWHCITEEPLWIQCTTGGMIEYPIELRMVTLESNRMSHEVLGVASDEMIAESLAGAEWVRDTDKDRQGELVL